MASPEFQAFLQRRMEGARSLFDEAKCALEDYEREWYRKLFEDPWQMQAQALADNAHTAYEMYKKAWVEWYAAVNGFALRPPRENKLTEAFGAPVPLHRVIAGLEADL